MDEGGFSVAWPVVGVRGSYNLEGHQVLLDDMEKCDAGVPGQDFTPHRRVAICVLPSTLYRTYTSAGCGSSHHHLVSCRNIIPPGPFRPPCKLATSYPPSHTGSWWLEAVSRNSQRYELHTLIRRPNPCLQLLCHAILHTTSRLLLSSALPPTLSKVRFMLTGPLNGERDVSHPGRQICPGLS